MNDSFKDGIGRLEAGMIGSINESYHKSDILFVHHKHFHKRVFPLIILLLFSLLTHGQKDELRDEINKIIKYDTEIEYENTPGFIVGIIDEDSTFILDFGHADIEKTVVLDKTSIFEVGSISKVYLASLVAILVDKLIISYEDKVNEILPEEHRNEHMVRLTIGQLLNHTSGFPKLPSSFGIKQENAQNPYAQYTKTDLLSYYREFKPIKRKKANKANCLYSHVNFGLLEIVLEFALKERFENILDQYLFAPLKLDNTFVGEHREDEITLGYDRTMKKVNPWSFGSFEGSEGLKSSLGDLLIFIRAQMDNKLGYSTIFSHSHEIGVPTSYNKKLFVGKGWHIVKNKAHYNIINHTGKTSGHQAFAAFVKETKTAVVILCNSANGVEDLGFLILRMINYNWRRKASSNE
jgi:CubicO group peptidase (beta-lactamase class C family)